MSSSGSSQIGLNSQVTEKLTRTNYVLWRVQITPQLRGAGVFGYADGSTLEPARFLPGKDKDGKDSTEPNPLHPIWVREDQQVLGYLLNNLSKEVLVQVTAITTTHALWTTLAAMFSSQSLSRVNNIRTALLHAQKGTQPVATFFAHMRGLADELAAAGKPLQDDEIVSYIIHALDMEYQPLVSALDARTSPVTLDELFTMLSNFDQRMALYQGSGGFKSSANAASRGRGGRRGGPPRGKNRSGGGGTSSNNTTPRTGRSPSTNSRGRGGCGGRGSNRARPDAPRCQICGKLGHTARDCWYRYDEDDEDSQDEDNVAAAADGSYGVDTNWYVDSAATEHITSELEKVTTREKYRGKDQIHTASGAGSGHEESALSR